MQYLLGPVIHLHIVDFVVFFGGEGGNGKEAAIGGAIVKIRISKEKDMLSKLNPGK